MKTRTIVLFLALGAITSSAIAIDFHQGWSCNTSGSIYDVLADGDNGGGWGWDSGGIYDYEAHVDKGEAAFDAVSRYVSDGPAASFAYLEGETGLSPGGDEASCFIGANLNQTLVSAVGDEKAIGEVIGGSSGVFDPNSAVKTQSTWLKFASPKEDEWEFLDDSSQMASAAGEHPTNQNTLQVDIVANYDRDTNKWTITKNGEEYAVESSFNAVINSSVTGYGPWFMSSFLWVGGEWKGPGFPPSIDRGSTWGEEYIVDTFVD